MEAGFKALQGSLVTAETYLALWEDLRIAQSQADLVRTMKSYSLFFSSIDKALFGSVVVNLYSVLETRTDTYNFSSLLRSIAREKAGFDPLPWQAKLAPLRGTWIKIGILRNEVVGHVTSKREMRAAFAHAALTPKELKEFISALQHLLSDISTAARGAAMIFGFGFHHDYKVESLIRRLATGKVVPLGAS